MAWSICTRNFPRIRSYAEALAYHEKTKPFKDSAHRPLDRRSARHKSMYMRDDGSQALAFRLYRTDLVTYFPDGQVSVECHSSVSSNAFVCGLLPPGISASNVYGRMMYSANHDHFTSTSALKFVCDPATNDWALANPDDATRFTKNVVNLKKAAQARKLLAPFKHWAEVYMRLRPDGPALDGKPAEDRYLQRLLAENLAKPEEFPPLLAVLKKRHGWSPTRRGGVWDDARIALYAAFDVVETVALPLGSKPHLTS